MKVGDDNGKKYRRQFLKRDPVQEKMDRYGTVFLVLVILYFGGHFLYQFFE